MSDAPLLSVTLKKVVFGGQTLGHTPEGKVVFVWGGLEGEKVKVRPTKKKKGFLEGVVVSVEEPSPDRKPEREEHYLSCSPWQITDYSKESEWKKAMTVELFKRSFDIDLPDFEIMTPSEPYGYRNKLEFSFTNDSDGILHLAFFHRQSKIKRPIDGCVLGMPEINTVARAVRDILREQGIESRHLKSLMLRASQDGRIAATLYVTDKNMPPISSEMSAVDGISRFSVVYSDPRSPASVTAEIMEDYGDTSLEDTILGSKFSYETRSFFQVNVEMYEYALADIQNYVLKDSTLFDTHAGVGVIGIVCKAKERIFIEPDDMSREYIGRNCMRNGVKDFHIIDLSAEKHLTWLEKEGGGLAGDATFIFDPPRAGLNPKIIRRMRNMQPQRIIYLSCNPATQARDLAQLLETYDLKFFKAYNFFPRTPHIETLAVLDLK